MADLVTAAWPAVERRFTLARQWRVFVHAERATIKAIRDATAVHAADVGRARQARLDGELSSQELERAAMAAEDAASCAQEAVLHRAAAVADELRAFAMAPFTPHFSDEGLPLHFHRQQQHAARRDSLLQTQRSGCSSTSATAAKPGVRTPPVRAIPRVRSPSMLAMGSPLHRVALSDGFRASAGLPTRAGFGSGVADVLRCKAHGPPSSSAATQSMPLLPKLHLQNPLRPLTSPLGDDAAQSAAATPARGPPPTGDRGGEAMGSGRPFRIAVPRRRSSVASVHTAVGVEGAVLFALLGSAEAERSVSRALPPLPAILVPPEASAHLPNSSSSSAVDGAASAPAGHDLLPSRAGGRRSSGSGGAAPGLGDMRAVIIMQDAMGWTARSGLASPLP